MTRLFEVELAAAVGRGRGVERDHPAEAVPSEVDPVLGVASPASAAQLRVGLDRLPDPVLHERAQMLVYEDVADEAKGVGHEPVAYRLVQAPRDLAQHAAHDPVRVVQQPPGDLVGLASQLAHSPAGPVHQAAETEPGLFTVCHVRLRHGSAETS